VVEQVGKNMSGTAWAWAGRAGATAVLAVVVWRLGTGPFLDGVSAVNGAALAAAAAIGALTTVCCAWRWTIVAGGLGVHLSLPGAVAAYYRSIFLNLTLPGGVVGDVHRGVRHGRDVGDVGGALRAVVWERAAGQAVQVVLTVVVLLVLPSPVRPFMPLVALALVAVVTGVVLAMRARPRAGRSKWAAVAMLSAVVVIGHAVTFVIAARAAGVTAPPSEILPLALLAMLAMVLPSVAGWGPREGATAGLFAAAGLGAAQGVATAVVYGVVVLAASLPGAVVLIAAWFPRRAPVLIRPDGAADA
jgi:glycosyltransferase 2 family protein